MTISKGFGRREAINMNTPSGKSDFLMSAEALEEELPNCGSVTVVVSWFGDDLRCGDCQIKPKVEQTSADGVEMAWSVADVVRSDADVVAFDNERPVYGGTPADAAVVEALRDLTSRD